MRGTAGSSIAGDVTSAPVLGIVSIAKFTALH